MHIPRILIASLMLAACTVFAQRPGGFTRARPTPTPRPPARTSPGRSTPRETPRAPALPSISLGRVEYRFLRNIYEFAEISWQVPVTKNTAGRETLVVTAKFLDKDGFALHATHGFPELSQGETKICREITRIPQHMWEKVDRVVVEAL